MQYYDEKMMQWNKTRKRSNAEKVNDKTKDHQRKKEQLGHRVQVLRVLVRRHYAAKRDAFTEDQFCKQVEAVLDNVLHKYDYDLEHCIDSFRKIVPALQSVPTVCTVCEYRPPFCLC